MANRYEDMNRYITPEESLRTRRKLAGQSQFSINDALIDERWANFQWDSGAPRQHFDYYYSAQDIRVYVAGLSDSQEFMNLPIMGLGFRVEQEKAPIYGYNSYTYDGVMRGTRLVSGEMTLVTKSPNYMKRLLAAAARARAGGNNNDYYPAPGHWTNDDENIDRYWHKTIDPSAQSQSGTEWSIHPPFDLVIVYGIQDISIGDVDYDDMYARYDKDVALSHDHNQRLVEHHDSDSPSRHILAKCELTAVQKAYSPDSHIVAEKYEFFAKDIFTPENFGPASIPKNAR